ncbi:MAG: NAD(P)-dependent oxidoreductase [Candidatus Vogelbacteria bacterium]|nr:NAD(P)-dependent oxidoreductase [Candidatus Vogelbacteria bacterium]
MKSKVWVTGSSGFIGSALVKSLREHAFNVTCITNSETVQKDAVFVNYESRESIRSVLAEKGVPDILFHLGWGNVYEPQSPIHLEQNLKNTKTLLDELYERGLKKAILVGSSSEYGSREGCLSESDPPMGRLTNYAQGKIEACQYGFEAAKKYHRIFIHVRLFHTLGVGDRQSSLINQLYKSYRDSKVLGLTSCEQFRDYIYLSDAAEGMVRMSGINSSEIVNLGSGNKIRLKELIELFWKRLSAPPELLKFGVHERPGHEPVQPPCYASLEKLMKLTNWQPLVSIEEAVSKTVSELETRS